MCRWVAYSGAPIFMEDLVTQPSHSLVEQSLNTEMNYKPDGSLWSTNGDGFGVGWYAEKEEPGLFKDESPAWSNNNLRNICAQVRTHLFFAHIRASTTGETQRSNCHPFGYQKWIFQHNGHVHGFEAMRQDLHADIGPDLYQELKGTTDSETLFLLALTYGLQDDPKAALQKMVRRLQIAARDFKTDGEFNLSCALSDGESIYTIRYAEHDKPKSQFYSDQNRCVEDFANESTRLPEDSVVIVSEPLDGLSDKWEEVPENSFTTIRDGKVSIETFM